MLILEWPKLLVRECNMMWALTSEPTADVLGAEPLKQRRNVVALKQWIRESSNATPGLFQGSVPMQVSAVNEGGKGEKGKNKMTGDKERARARGNSKHKNSDSSKRKERDSWNGGQQQEHFPGYCSHCSKWGHKRADCRTALAQQKNGAVAGIQEPSPHNRRVGVLQP